MDSKPAPPAPVDLAAWDEEIATAVRLRMQCDVPPAVLATLVAAVRAAIVVRDALARHGQGYAVLDQTLAAVIDTAGPGGKR